MSYFEKALNAALSDTSEPLKVSVCYYKNAEYSFSNNQTERKSIPCRFFMKGDCVRADCPYLHERDPSRKQKFKTELCANFSKDGFCKFGDTCTFAHGSHELRQS